MMKLQSMPDCFGTTPDQTLGQTLSCEACLYQPNCVVAVQVGVVGRPALPQSEKQGPLNTQVGGGHYKSLKIQPAEYCYANNIGKLEGDAIYYLTRWRNKNGVEDLLKARHTIDILIEMGKKHG